MKKSFFRVIICTALFFCATNTAMADDWRIFGTFGTIQIIPKGGAAVTINNNNSLMMKVPDGATIQVIGKGKIIVVSLKSRKAFEIGDNSTAIAGPDIIHVVRGTVNPKTGFAPPTGKDGKIGGIVMRSGAENTRSCLKALSPLNTSILGPNPELRWENHCSGLPRVTVTILSDERIVHSAEVASSSSYRLPEKLLKDGSRYLWMVDGGASFDVTSGVFVMSTGKEREEVQQRMKEVSSDNTPENRLAYIYFLADLGFSEMAKDESSRLRAAFPESSALSDLP